MFTTSTDVAANSSFSTFSSTDIDISAFSQCGFEKEYRNSAVPFFRGSGEWAQFESASSRILIKLFMVF
jgi:hypothetical protein